MSLRNEIEKILRYNVYRYRKYGSEQEATDQILSLLEGAVKTNNITWTKLGDRTFISRDELLEKLK